MKLENLKTLLESLSLLKAHPELYLSDYFTKLRNDIDNATETHLAALEGEPSEVASKIQGLNTIREWMLDELKDREQALLSSLSATPRQELDNDLIQRVETLSSHLDPSSGHFKEMFKKSAIEIQQSIFQVQSDIMQHHTVAFIKTERIGKLFIFKGLSME